MRPRQSPLRVSLLDLVEGIETPDRRVSLAIRSIQRFTLGFDHRIVDGADAGKFMSDFKAYLENWSEDIG